jgi:hypothetical protein
MPEEIEVPTEQLQDEIDEGAEKAREGSVDQTGKHPRHETSPSGSGGGHHKKHHERHERSSRWIPGVALSSAIMAVLAAISALLAGHHANEGVMEQIQAGDQWSYYQAKGIKGAVLETKVDLLRELGKPPNPDDAKKLEGYKTEQKEIETKAHEYERSSDQHMSHHNVFARTVTMFQIAIAMAAISVLSKRKWLWHVSLLLSGGGLVFLVQAFL